MHNTKQKKPHISPQINLIHGVIVSGLASSVIYRVLETRSDNPKTIRKVWRCQRGNEKPQVQQEQTTQWPKDTKGVMRSRKSNKNRQHNAQNIPKDLRLLITPLVSFGHCVVCSCWTCGFSLPLWYLLGIVLSVLVGLAASHYPFGIFCSICDTRRVTLVTNPMISLYHRNHDRNHKLWNIGSNERYILQMQVPLECCYI
jgi:hypothetical protein